MTCTRTNMVLQFWSPCNGYCVAELTICSSVQCAGSNGLTDTAASVADRTDTGATQMCPTALQFTVSKWTAVLIAVMQTGSVGKADWRSHAALLVLGLGTFRVVQSCFCVSCRRNVSIAAGHVPVAMSQNTRTFRKLRQIKRRVTRRVPHSRHKSQSTSGEMLRIWRHSLWCLNL
jgi:hypothetical protein